MQLFQLIQNNFAAVGISWNLVAQPYPVNGKISLGFFILIISVICNLMYIVREAKTFAEYTQSIHMCSVATLILFALVIVLLNVKKLFNLINGCQKIVNTSE